VNELFVPLKSFDCFTCADHVALEQVVGSAGDKTWTDTVIERPGARASPEVAERS
jgi:hypothetical protein